MDAVFGEGSFTEKLSFILCLMPFQGNDSKRYLHDYSEQVALFARSDHDTEETNEYGESASDHVPPKRQTHRESRKSQGYERLNEEDE